MKSTTPRGRLRRPRGVVDDIEMSDVAAFLAADTTDVLAADTTDVLSAAKAASGGFCPAKSDDDNNDWLWGATFGYFWQLFGDFWQISENCRNLVDF